MQDITRSPRHYQGEIQPIDFIKSIATTEDYKWFCLGNVIKYIARHEKKGAPVEDLQKAEQYLKWAIEAEIKCNE